MNLSQISFPVFKLSKFPPSQVDGVTFYLKEDKAEIIDDKTVPGDSLARRRLHLHMNEVKLYKLKTAIFFLADLIKLADPKQWFVDSNGKCFIYTKTRQVPLVYREITDIKRYPLCAIIEAKGIHGRHKSLYPPKEDQKFAGFLQMGHKSYLLYGFYEQLEKDTRRKI